MYRQIGNIVFEKQPSIISYASVAGGKESEGPLKNSFDYIFSDSYAGQNTFEQAESVFTGRAVEIAMDKADMRPIDIDTAFCGDLLNQCIASSFAMRRYGVRYAGIYGACSTMGLGLIMAAISVESGASGRALSAASSHYCTAERQYRFPLEYGSQRPPTAQWTVTAAGACIVADDPKDVSAPYISAARLGRIIDFGIKDQNNMGAAMAPAICIIRSYPMLKNAGCIYVFTIILQKRRFLLQIAAETIKWIFRVNLTSTGGVECQRKFQPKTRDTTYRRTTMNCPN